MKGEYVENPTRPRFKDSNLICFPQVEEACYHTDIRFFSAQTIWQLSIALALVVSAIGIVVFLKRFRYIALVPFLLASFIIYFFIYTTYFFTDSAVDPTAINQPINSQHLLSSQNINSIACDLLDHQKIKAVIAQKKICASDWCMTPTRVKETGDLVIISDESNSIILVNKPVGKMVRGVHSSTSKSVDLRNTFCL